SVLSTAPSALRRAAVESGCNDLLRYGISRCILASGRWIGAVTGEGNGPRARDVFVRAARLGRVSRHVAGVWLALHLDHALSAFHRSRAPSLGTLRVHL